MPEQCFSPGDGWRILAAITFHFRESRLQYLFQVIRALCEFPANSLDVVVLTNVDNEIELGKIRDLCAPLFNLVPTRKMSARSFSLESYPSLEDSWLLPWCHKHLISENFLGADSDYSHFIYLEDDILLSVDNFRYFVHYRELLKDKGLIPSFQRIEYNDNDNRLYLVDQIGVTKFNGRNRVDLDGYAFINLDYPYNAMFILDRELAHEYVQSPSFDRERSKDVKPDWDVAARAAMCLCFENPPPGFSLRYVSPVDPSTLLTPTCSWIYHLPNNYVKNRFTPFAKIRIDQLFAVDSGPVAIGWRRPGRCAEFFEKVRKRLAGERTQSVPK